MENAVINKLDHLDFYRSEAYKTLRTNIMFSGDDIKVIALTSCTPGEGKTTVSLNLAVDMAKAGKKVVYVDADLRQSVLVGRYKINGIDKGMSHFLSGQCTVNECLYATNINNLYIIPSGPVTPNPSELLGGKPFKQMISVLRKAFDYVIIDTAPLGSVIDSAVAAKECDGAVMILKANSIDKHFAVKVKEQLALSGCRLLGAVLTMVPVKKGSYYSKYYNKYYNKYYGKDYASL